MVMLIGRRSELNRSLRMGKFYIIFTNIGTQIFRTQSQPTYSHVKFAELPNSVVCADENILAFKYLLT